MLDSLPALANELTNHGCKCTLTLRTLTGRLGSGKQYQSSHNCRLSDSEIYELELTGWNVNALFPLSCAVHDG